MADGALATSAESSLQVRRISQRPVDQVDAPPPHQCRRNMEKGGRDYQKESEKG